MRSFSRVYWLLSFHETSIFFPVLLVYKILSGRSCLVRSVPLGGLEIVTITLVRKSNKSFIGQ